MCFKTGASVRYDDNTVETAVRSLTKLVVVHCSLIIGHRSLVIGHCGLPEQCGRGSWVIDPQVLQRTQPVPTVTRLRDISERASARQKNLSAARRLRKGRYTLLGRASPTALLRGKPVKQVASSFTFFASPLRLRSCLKTQSTPSETGKDRKGLHLEFQISDFKSQIPGFRLKGLPIREFVAASSLCELCASFAFFALRSRFGKRKVRQAKPCKDRKGLHLEFYFSLRLIRSSP